MTNQDPVKIAQTMLFDLGIMIDVYETDIKQLRADLAEAKSLLQKHMDYHDDRGSGRWTSQFKGSESAARWMFDVCVSTHNHYMFDVCVRTLKLIGKDTDHIVDTNKMVDHIPDIRKMVEDNK